MENAIQIKEGNKLLNAKTISAIIVLGIVVIIMITESELKLFSEIRRAISFSQKIEKISEIVEDVSEEETSSIETNNDINNEEDNEIRKEAEEIRIALNKGRNSVTIKNNKGLTRYDLGGKGHGGIETPHKHIYRQNIVNGEVKSITEISQSPVKITKKDLEIIRTYFKSIAK